MKVTKISAYNTKTRQAEIFRRAAAGEVFLVTNNGKPQAEIRQATPARTTITKAIKALQALQNKQLAKGKGGTQRDLRKLMEEGRD